MITTAKPGRRNWMTPLLIAAASLALMLGVGLASPNSSAATAAAPGSGSPQRSALTPNTTCELAWRVVSNPDLEAEFRGTLNGVDAVSANDVWAVGLYRDGTGQRRTLTKHWDGSSWSIVPSPNAGNGANVLNGVAAISANNVWAVGYRLGTTIGTLTMHWDGASWSVVPSPSPSPGVLAAVAAISANDVWAVGYYEGSTGGTHTMHWDGTRWSVVLSPNLGTGANRLTAVDAVSANDVWAVGSVSFAVPMTMHWDGTRWSVVSNPGPSSGQLDGVAAISANNVWAVGSYLDGVAIRTLTMHWNGASWSVVPNPGPSSSHLDEVAALSANDVWAVGFYNYNNSSLRTLTMHWDGTSWSIVPSPNVEVENLHNRLYGVAISANDVWAVGYSYQRQSNGAEWVMQLHWNGAGWERVPSLSLINGQGYLNSVAAVSANDVWAVGRRSYASRNGTLTMHWDGASWSDVPSPSPGTSYLTAVAAISANDVWAVGSSTSGMLIIHWDGVSWSVIPSLNSPSGGLTAVAAISANDVWAVGSSINGTLTMHWDGASWSVVPSPSPGTSYLSGVAAVSANDVWAVGYSYFVDEYGNEHYDTLTMHWDGTRWSVVPSPSGEGYQNYLSGVATVSANDVWAVGYYVYYDEYSGEYYSAPLTMRWDGAGWSMVPNPSTYGHLTAVEVISANDVWAVGSDTMHWDGDIWSIVPGPSPGYLAAVGAVSVSDIWAVGNSYDGATSRTLTIHYSEDCPVSTPTPTSTPTGIPATATPTATATPCPLYSNYGVAVSTNQFMIPATNYVPGSRCSNCTVNVPLPFAYSLYDTSFTSVNVSSEGNLQFTSNSTSGNNRCLPSSTFMNAIMPYWDSLDASTHNFMGTFTSVVGAAPNRIFVIEYRGGKRVGKAVYMYDYEVLLYEGQQRFDIIYGAMPEAGSSATIGVQEGISTGTGTGGRYTQFSCNTRSIQPSGGDRIRFDRSTCPHP